MPKPPLLKIFLVFLKPHSFRPRGLSAAPLDTLPLALCKGRFSYVPQYGLLK